MPTVPAASASDDSVAVSLQVITLFVVFLLLLSAGVCCSLQALCRKYKCCASVYGARDSSFDALVARAGSGFREDLLSDDELQRLWVCSFCDFANYEMKLECALCGHAKHPRDFTQSPRRKPSAVRAAALLSGSFSNSTASTLSSSGLSASALLAHALSPTAAAANSPQIFTPSFLIHTPLAPLPESPTSSCSGIELATPPDSPLRSAAPLSFSLPLMTDSEDAAADNDVRLPDIGVSSRCTRRKEWQTRIAADNSIVWTRNIDQSAPWSVTTAGSNDSDNAASSYSPATSSSSTAPTESIVEATAFVSRVVALSSAETAAATASRPASSSPSLVIEPAEGARVYAALEAVNTDVAHASCGVESHGIESVRPLPFPEKHRWFLQETAALLHTRWRRPEQSHDLTLVVARDDLLATTVRGLMHATQDELRRPLRVQFATEPGVDAGGIVREWVGLAVAAFLDPAAGLFQSVHTSADGLAYTVHPNASLSVSAHLVHLRAFGRLLGKALLEGHLVAAPLTDVLFKHIVGAPLSFADLEAIDHMVAHSLEQLWSTSLPDSDDANDADPYALDFSVYDTARGIVDLKPNGRGIPVVGCNKREYVALFVQWQLAQAAADEVSALVCGIYDVVPLHLLAPFDYTELRLLLGGSPTIDIDDWEAHAVVIGVAGRPSRAVARLTKWFWRQLRARSAIDQARILQFATGSPRVPIQGFKALTASDGRLCPFTLQCFATTDCAFLRAYTCFNRLDVPLYKSEQELADALTQLLQTDVTGFSVQ